MLNRRILRWIYVAVAFGAIACGTLVATTVVTGPHGGVTLRPDLSYTSVTVVWTVTGTAIGSASGSAGQVQVIRQSPSGDMVLVDRRSTDLLLGEMSLSGSLVIPAIPGEYLSVRVYGRSSGSVWELEKEAAAQVWGTQVRFAGVNDSAYPARHDIADADGTILDSFGVPAGGSYDRQYDTTDYVAPVTMTVVTQGEEAGGKWYRLAAGEWGQTPTVTRAVIPHAGPVPPVVVVDSAVPTLSDDLLGRAVVYAGRMFRDLVPVGIMVTGAGICYAFFRRYRRQESDPQREERRKIDDEEEEEEEDEHEEKAGR